MENTFITYEAALKILAENKTNFPNVEISIDDACGQFLAEDLIADRDFPPFDRVAMDGIAINFKSIEKGATEFAIETVAAAGAAQKILENENHCIEIMTGAILPKNCDTVIRYEDLEIKNGIAKLLVNKIKKRQNIHFKGIDLKAETIIKKAGERISIAEINVAATIGKKNLTVKKMPKVAIVSSGNELVNIDENPLPHQIRKSNAYGIKNTFEEWGIKAKLYHLKDDKTEMKNSLQLLIDEFDVLVVSGGVSKGKFDFLPEVLNELGVVKHFHKIQQRPGKPIWFGSKAKETFVFGLPGNPVSSVVCTYAYIRFWLLQSLNIENKHLYVELKNEVNFSANLTYFLQAKLEAEQSGKLVAKTIKGNGSGDFANLVHADGFVILPQEKQVFKKGEVYPFLPYRQNF